jgi:regulator of RNase E activity RraA
MTDTDGGLADFDTGRLQHFSEVQSGVVCDSLGRLGLSGWMDGVRPIRLGTKMVGRARTLRFGPRRGTPVNIQMYSFIRSLNPGDVLVIATGNCNSWIFGENVAHAALHQGCVGIVTDARARDGAELAELGLGCFCSGLATRPPSSIEIVATDVAVECGGAQVHPGDIVVGDADGIVIVPGGMMEEVLIQVEEIAALEVEQELAIARCAPLPELEQIIKRKKIRKR